MKVILKSMNTFFVQFPYFFCNVSLTYILLQFLQEMMASIFVPVKTLPWKQHV